MNIKAKGAWIGGSGSWGTETANFPLLDPRIKKVEFLEPLETPFGTSASPHFLMIGDEPILHFTMHGWQRDPSGKSIPTWERSKQVAWVLQQSGVEWAVVEASVGGIARPDNGELLPPWSVVITDDLIPMYMPSDFPPVLNPDNPYPRMRDPFCSVLSGALFQEASSEPKFVHVANGGVYVCTKTGRFEFTAEIEAFRQLGGHIVGQTLAYEVVLLKQLGIHFASLNIVSNYAEGVCEHWVGDDSPGAMAEFYLECPTYVVPTMVGAIETILTNGINGCSCNAHRLTGMHQFPTDFNS